MTTVINNPGNNEVPAVVQPSGTGPIVAVMITAVLVVLFFVYILPFIRNVQNTKSNGIDVNVKMPAGLTPATTGADATPTPTPVPTK